MMPAFMNCSVHQIVHLRKSLKISAINGQLHIQECGTNFIHVAQQITI